MKTSAHVIISLILAAILYPIFSWNVMLILVGGVLIDIDHYFWFAYKFKKFSLFDCYYYYIDGMEKDKVGKNIGILLMFHTIEFLLAIILLSFYNELALIFTIGVLAHYLLDAIFLYTVAGRLIANPSTISWIVKNKIQKI